MHEDEYKIFYCPTCNKRFDVTEINSLCRDGLVAYLCPECGSCFGMDVVH